jgi:hypothetical protein
MYRGFTVAVALVAILTGCSPSATTAGTTTVTVTAPQANAPLPNSAGSTTPNEQAAVGEAQTTSAGAKITPLTFESPPTRPVDSDRFPDVQNWAVVDAELCAGTESINKTGYGFSLIDADHREYRAYDSTAQPFEPTIRTGDLAPGECARGYVNYELPEGIQIVAVRWEYPGDGGPLRWAVK